MEINDLKIQQGILHILDMNNGLPLLSDQGLEIEADTFDFLYAHVLNILEELDLRELTLVNDENAIWQQVKSLNDENFVQVSKEICQIIFDYQITQPMIPSGDFLLLEMLLNDKEYLGLLKFEYKESYIHYVDQTELGINNKIICQRVSLPGLKQKAVEAFFMEKEGNRLLIKDKKYEINGEKKAYLSEILLEAETAFSVKEKLNKYEKTMKNFVKKYCDDDLEVIQKVKTEMVKQADEKGEISFDEVVDEVFFENTELKNLCHEELIKKGIEDTKVEATEKVQKNITKKHRIVIDNGIEVKLPIEYMDRADKIEIINQPDGSISFVIKNIESIK